jgi:FixJ family two-component response regulator
MFFQDADGKAFLPPPDAGHDVRTLSSALDFVHCRNLESPSCFILDVGMPDLNGLELQEYLTDRGISLAIETDRRAKKKRKQLKERRERMETLTPREREVFQFVVTGLLNKQIAIRIGSAEKTVKVHRARVMAKMGAQSLADLVRLAYKLNTDSPPG